MKKIPDDDMEQISIRLPKDLLKDLGKGGKRTIGPEIRRRLQLPGGPEPIGGEEAPDPRTKELLSALTYLAANVPDYYGPWSQDRFAFDVLREAIDRILTQRFRPKGNPVAAPTDLADLVFGEGDHLKNVETMGRMIAAIWLSSNPKQGAG